ncbi:MAG: MBL fold metallo-hydrolase [Hyphomonadaceae bacterium]|nr:MBL fold metallo-hydrolase [Hyphomonadaceae bacterium]
MKDLLDRREVVGLAGAAGVAVLAGCAGGLQSGAVPGKTAGELDVVELAPGVKLISGAGSNVLAVAGPEGALLVDGGLAQHAPGLIQRALAETGSGKIARLINTHWHLEATGANDLLGAKGTPILAHENTRLWMGTEISSRWQDEVYPPRVLKARPTETFYTTKEIVLGGESIELGHLLQAHTDGDIYVRLRQANVIAAGGVLSGQGWPIIDWQTGGWIGGMVRGLETLIAQTDDSTLIVPADGAPLKRQDLVKQRDMYVTIMGRLKTMMESGFSADKVVAGAPAKEFEAERGDASEFLRLAFRSFWGHVRQFDVV